jgi:hypothetical protein
LHRRRTENEGGGSRQQAVGSTHVSADSRKLSYSLFVHKSQLDPELDFCFIKKNMLHPGEDTTAHPISLAHATL